MTLDKVIQVEKNLGGEISYLNLETTRNSFPPHEIFSENEKYHIDIVTKQISDSYEVESSYWVQESNNSIPAIYLDWSSLRYNSGFDPEAKYEELVRVITDFVGPGKLFPQTSSKMMYSEWHTNQSQVERQNVAGGQKSFYLQRYMLWEADLRCRWSTKMPTCDGKGSDLRHGK